jgi:hypothetical protein
VRPESRRNAVVGAVGFALAWVLLSFLASSLVEGLPNIWWLGLPGAVVVYLLVRRFGGAIRGRS